ncbi:thiamine diphosphokinase [Spiroplasma endosymbiont of Labia minor]|uniref:thiamine diphosphokinase n=1 Tax=Spiroplasma endosymbiont of Labia minor TaxID=3066305 RepID=UPI0030CAAD2B
MQNNKALIVAAENNLNLSYYKNFYKIGVERGCLDLINKNMILDLAVSDFDNVSKTEKNIIEQKAKKFIQLDTEKDFLDGEIAIQNAIKNNCNEIIMIVKPTTRYDMNLSVFDFIFRYDVKIISENSISFKLEKGENILSFSKFQEFRYISFFSKNNTTVTIKGLKFEINSFLLEPFSTRLISNTFFENKDGCIFADNFLICVISK